MNLEMAPTETGKNGLQQLHELMEQTMEQLRTNFLQAIKINSGATAWRCHVSCVSKTSSLFILQEVQEIQRPRVAQLLGVAA
mmetsp:Transcript_42266/g.92215  ORF Transcript_42266/g.92215 Transcript_42266/m.92215 type:complete len:82 (+) Transcript_42266:30-275(+)